MKRSLLSKKVRHLSCLAHDVRNWDRNTSNPLRVARMRSTAGEFVGTRSGKGQGILLALIEGIGIRPATGTKTEVLRSMSQKDLGLLHPSAPAIDACRDFVLVLRAWAEVQIRTSKLGVPTRNVRNVCP